MPTDDYYHHPRPEMAALLPADARRILDIGCGAGRFAGDLKERHGLEAWGIELDETAAARAGERLDRVLCGDAGEQLHRLPAAHFDVVYLNDILEHLVDPEPVLRDVAAKLAPGGRVIASIPNVRHFPHLWQLVVHGRWEYEDEGILDRTHLRFFTRSSMLAMFARCGYRVERCQGIHPTRSARFRLFNLVTLGLGAEMRYLQFALVATPLTT